MKTLMVKVAPLEDLALAGKAKVTREGTVGRFHLESDGVFEVEASSYYHRRLAHGELILASKPKPAKKRQPAESDEPTEEEVS